MRSSARSRASSTVSAMNMTSARSMLASASQTLGFVPNIQSYMLWPSVHSGGHIVVRVLRCLLSQRLRTWSFARWSGLAACRSETAGLRPAGRGINSRLRRSPFGRTRFARAFVAPLRGRSVRTGVRILILSPSQKKRAPMGPVLFGWGRGIRTPVDGVRVRSPTTRRSPKRDPKALALRVLRCAAGLAEADFLALDLAGVARDEASLAERRTQ